MSMTLSGIGFVFLPNPDLKDTEARDISVNSQRAMDGTRYTYVKSSTRKRLTFTFSFLDRNKMFELQIFLKANKGEIVSLLTHNSQSFNGIIENESDDFDAARRSAGNNKNETGSYSFTFVGE